MSWCKIDHYEYLTGDEILPPNRSQIIEQAKLIYFRLKKALEIEKKVDVLKFQNISNKTDELKQIKGIFPKKLLNDLIS